MSQRNVNLRSFNYGQQSQKIIDRSYQASMGIISGIAKQQEEDRRKSEQAMLLGDATTEQLTEEYTKKLGSASAETKAQLTAYAREQAQLIGAAKTKAFAPGATQADKDNYYKTLSQGTSNLEAIATYSTLAAKDLNTYKSHLSGVRNGTSLGTITRDALNNNKDIAFNAGLASGLAKDIKIVNDSNGHAVISFTDQNGEVQSQDIWASNEAFKQTGTTIQSQVITEDDLITNQKVLDSIEKQVDGFNDIKSTSQIVETIDLNNNTKSRVKRSKRVDVGDNLYNNHKDFLGQETKNSSFNKKWDQLNNLGYLNDPFARGEEGKYKNISWNTFNQQNVDKAVESINSNERFRELDPTQNTPFTKEDYLNVQSDIRDYAARSYANFIDSRLGQEKDEVLESTTIYQKGDTEGQSKLVDYTEIYNASTSIKDTSSRLKDFNVGPASLQPFVKGIGLKGLMEKDIDKLDEKSKQIRLDLEKNIKIGEKFANKYNGRVHALEGSRSAIIDVNNKENPVIQVTEQGLVFNIYDDKGNVKIQYDLSDPNQILTFENNLVGQETGVKINDKTSALNTLTN
jgi:hypothetical protein